MRDVKLFQRRDLFLAELHCERGGRVVEMPRLGRADNRRRHFGLLQKPGKRDLCARETARRGDLSDAFDYCAVGFKTRRIKGSCRKRRFRTARSFRPSLASGVRARAGSRE